MRIRGGSKKEFLISDHRPNILLAIADDWAWPHGGAYGCRFVKTPNFDRVAQTGTLWENNFCPSPSCAPSRAALLTGRHPWELEEGVNLWGLLPAKFAVYPDLLEAAGYHIGLTNKGWGPGSVEDSGRPRNPAGPMVNDKTCTPPTACMNANDYAANFQDFLDARPNGAPFCFWYGAKEPHRPYEKGSGLRAGKKLADVDVPPYLPDCEEVRSDLLDYALETEYFDSHLGRMIDMLEERGELENTIIVVTGDNGMPFPRSKANLYELGMHVPMAISWPAKVPGGRRITDFTTFIDLAPTFLEAAGVTPPDEMTGKSVLPILLSDRLGRVDERRDRALTCRERHAFCRGENLGYPIRCIRTDEWVYIRNFEPQRWPAGDPGAYGDVDGSPTKHYMVRHRKRADVKPLFDLAFGKRPQEELYAVHEGYACMNNVAADPANEAVRETLWHRLESDLKRQGDPRVLGRGAVFDTYTYYGKASEKAFVGYDDMKAQGLIDETHTNGV